MLALGLDAGGSRTRALLIDVDGDDAVVRGIGHGPGANATSVGLAAASAAIETALDQAFADVPGRRLDAAGFALADESALGPVARILCPPLAPGVSPWIGDDIPAAFSSGTRAHDGVVLIAGTGSVAAVIAHGEVRVTFGGWGWWYGDDGGATWLGREAVRAVMAHCDASGPSTALTPILLERFGIDAPDPYARKEALRSCLYDTPNAALLGASLAPVLSACPDDPVAESILDRAADALIAVCEQAIEAATSEPYGLHPSLPLVASGSVAGAPAIAARLAARFPAMRIVPSGLAGALLRGLGSAGHEASAALHERIVTLAAEAVASL